MEKTFKKLCSLTPITKKELKILSLVYQVDENAAVNMAIHNLMDYTDETKHKYVKMAEKLISK